MKWTVVLALVALMFLGGTVFAQGIRIEKVVEKKVENKDGEKEAESGIEIEFIEEEIEIEGIIVPDENRCDGKKCDGKKCDGKKCDGKKCDGKKCDGKKCDGKKCGEGAGCDGCPGKKASISESGAFAFAGDWSKLPPEQRAQILKELRLRYDDATLKRILKSLAAGNGKAAGHGASRVWVTSKPVHLNGKTMVAKPGEKVIVLEGSPDVHHRGRIVARYGDPKVKFVVEELAKDPEELAKLAAELKKARARVEQSRRAMTDSEGRFHIVGPKGEPVVQSRVVVRSGAHPAPPQCPNCAPKPKCQNCAPRPMCQHCAPKPACPNCAPRPAPRCGCQGTQGDHGYRPQHSAAPGGRGFRPPHGPIPQPPRHAGYDDALRRSLDGLRGEISALRHELRTMRGAHAVTNRPPAAGVSMGVRRAPTQVRKHVTATPGTPPLAYPKAPPPPARVAAPKKATGGFSFGVAPANKPSAREMKLEKEVASLKAEMAAMKDIMHLLLKKMDEMHKAQKK